MTAPPRTYEVGITYCNDQGFSHPHEDREPACQEYADMVAEGLEPMNTSKEAKHVRLVSLIIRDERGEVVRHVDSGVFACEHTS